jgi:hypothetical protein
MSIEERAFVFSGFSDKVYPSEEFLKNGNFCGHRGLVSEAIKAYVAGKDASFWIKFAFLNWRSNL